MSQAEVCPVAGLYHIKSALPSPLRSAAAVTFQLGSVISVALLMIPVPFMSHTIVCPEVTLYQTRSALPSPLRSAVAVTFHFGSVSSDALEVIPVPFINQI